MAKAIKITEDNISQWRQEFESILKSAKLMDGKIDFHRALMTTKRPCTVYFTEIAWLKMTSLIRECDKEVGWHGLAYRGEDETKDEYYITDILVYPQVVSAANVNTDQIKYQEWLMKQEDEVFNNIRMQGHSHVNMGVTPSVTDNDLYEKLLGQLDDTMFYIFMIYNKRGECMYKIYDMKKNVMFDTSDVTVNVIEDECGVEKFLREAKGMITENKPAYQQYGNYNGPAYNLNQEQLQSMYRNNYTQNPEQVKPAPVTPVAKVEQPKQVQVAQVAKQEKQEQPGSKKKHLGKKFKRSEKKEKKKSERSPYRASGIYADEMDDPYGPFGYSDGFYY